MNYKSIIKSRQTRLRILRFFSFLPDPLMLKLQYRIKTGRRLNLKNPTRYSEKIQWYKLNYKNEQMIQCVDKYDVREYIKNKGFENILTPCYGVYDTVDEIDFNSLPDQFVIKDTLGGGGNSVILVNDKSSVDLNEIKRTLCDWTSIKPYIKDAGREWPYYSGKKHRIIIEKLLSSEEYPEGLIDYKFFCFNGKVQFLYIAGDRSVGDSVKISIFDKNCNLLPVTRVGDQPFTEAKKPLNYDEMRLIAESLAADFPHVRVDLYNVNGTIYFGELTFYNASGYVKYQPDSFDFDAGKNWKI